MDVGVGGEFAVRKITGLAIDTRLLLKYLYVLSETYRFYKNAQRPSTRLDEILTLGPKLLIQLPGAEGIGSRNCRR
jgi:hypothetical protein